MVKNMVLVEDEIKVLKEQISILESYLRPKPKEFRKVTLKDYHEYLKKTKKAVKETIEPTKLLRKMRRKGAFY